jgi:hypothetical protein
MGNMTTKHERPISTCINTITLFNFHSKKLRFYCDDDYDYSISYCIHPFSYRLTFQFRHGLENFLVAMTVLIPTSFQLIDVSNHVWQSLHHVNDRCVATTTAMRLVPKNIYIYYQGGTNHQSLIYIYICDEHYPWHCLHFLMCLQTMPSCCSIWKYTLKTMRYWKIFSNINTRDIVR